MRQMLLVGEDPRKHISDFSNQFRRDFLQLLKTAHGEKKVHINHFYQEYIANKQHVHMNATQWQSLTEFAKFLGREGICRVEDTEKGLHISWIDNSPEALRRQDAIRKKERQDRGDEEREQRLIREQIERAELDAEEKAGESEDEEARILKRESGEKIVLSLGLKSRTGEEAAVPTPEKDREVSASEELGTENIKSESLLVETPTPPPETVALKLGTSAKPKNVFAGVSKKNGLVAKTKLKQASDRPMSEAERIMKEEIERKRIRETKGFSGLNLKRPRIH